MSVYQDEKTGMHYGICFNNLCDSEGKAIHNLPSKYSDPEQDIDAAANGSTKPQKGTTSLYETILSQWDFAEYLDGYRGILEPAAVAYQVGVFEGNIIFPLTDTEGNVKGFKVRGVDDKEFKSYAAPKTKIPDCLFGLHLCKGTKVITITEGELDAMSVYQMFGNRYDVVSIPNGCGSAVSSVKANYEFLNDYEKIVLSFDMDKPGQDAAVKVAELFPGKTYVMKMRHKDANDYLVAGQEKEFIQDWWAATKYMPDGIVNGKDLKTRMKEPIGDPICPWPWDFMNEKLFGIYPKRIYTFTAGSGVGKSQGIREVSYHVWKHSGVNVGIMMLEEGVEDSANGLISLHINKPLHIPTTQVSDDEYDSAFEAVFGSDRLYFHDHFGSTVIGNILNRAEYLIRVLGCRVIILDHLSIVVSGQDNPDERKAIDELMTKLRTLVQSTGAALLLVSHLSKHSKKVWTSGAEVSGHDLRGSASIEQLSDTIIAFERNLQAKKETARNTTRVRVLKNRKFGLTGLAGMLNYDPVTGRMFPGGEWEDTDDLDSEY